MRGSVEEGGKQSAVEGKRWLESERGIDGRGAQITSGRKTKMVDRGVTTCTIDRTVCKHLGV